MTYEVRKGERVIDLDVDERKAVANDDDGPRPFLPLGKEGEEQPRPSRSSSPRRGMSGASPRLFPRDSSSMGGIICAVTLA